MERIRMKWKNKKYRFVNYFGMEIQLDEYELYICTDEDGDIWACSDKPDINDYIDGFDVYCSQYQRLLGTVDLCGMNWKESLRYYPIEG